MDAIIKLLHWDAARLSSKESVCIPQQRFLHSLEYLVWILQTFTLYAQKYIVYADRHSFKLLMIDELGSEVSANLLYSVLNNAGEVCGVV